MGIAAEVSLHSSSDLKTQCSTLLYLEGHKISSRGVSRHKQYARTRFRSVEVKCNIMRAHISPSLLYLFLSSTQIQHWCVYPRSSRSPFVYWAELRCFSPGFLCLCLHKVFLICTYSPTKSYFYSRLGNQPKDKNVTAHALGLCLSCSVC